MSDALLVLGLVFFIVASTALVGWVIATALTIVGIGTSVFEGAVIYWALAIVLGLLK